jgi:GNAT superfamily N-acetyltransferase
MIELTLEQVAALPGRLLPGGPGPTVAEHVAATGYGTCSADRWPDPRALVAGCGGNYALSGDPAALRPADLGGITGFLDAPERFAPLLLDAFGDLREWPRVVLTLDGPPARIAVPPAYDVRRLGPADAGRLDGLADDTRWISVSWGGAAGLAGSRSAWGAFDGARLAAVACPFFVGSAYVDLGVVTEEDARGQGLSTACAAAVCDDVRARGLTPSWTTSPDNAASLRGAEKLGFALHHRDRLLAVGVPIPEPARRPPG